MKKIIFLFAAFLFVFQKGKAQNFEWVKNFGGTGTEFSRKILTDPLGNIYFFGSFQNTVDFDPGFGVFNLTSSGSNDVFICKFDSSVNFIWAKKFGGPGQDYEASFSLGSNGTIYLTGVFSSTADLDPNAGISSFTSNGLKDIFICKLNSNGTLIWAKQIGGAADDFSSDLKIDNSENIYFGGDFSDTVDFNPGAGTYYLSSIVRDAWITKLDANGNFIWAKSFTGSGDANCSSLAFDENQRLYAAGNFTSTADFDPGIGVFNMTSSASTDAYICKLDTNGNFIWAKQQGGSGTSNIDQIVVRLSDLYISGSYTNYADFDPGPGGAMVNSSSGSLDLYICKLDTQGNFKWVKPIYGTGTDIATAIAVDSLGFVYLFGSFGSSTIDFGPNIPTFTLTLNGYNNTFVSKQDSSGNFMWVRHMPGGTPGSSSNYAQGILVDDQYSIYLTGYYSNTFDANPTSGVDFITSSGGNDIYMIKLSQDLCSDLNLIIDTALSVSCLSNGYMSASAYFGFPPYTYVWNTNPQTFDSIINPLNAGPYSVSVTDMIGCTDSSTGLINGPVPSLNFDLNVNLLSTTFQPGFISNLYLYGGNVTCIPVTGSLSIVIDSLLSFVSAYPLPDSASGDTLIWNFQNFNIDDLPLLPHLILNTSTSAQIGDTVCFEVFITPIAGDADTTNNYKKYCFPVLNGYDPNDISVYPQGVCPEKYVLNDQKLTYTIRFQNTGNSNAININVLDSLDSDLDLNSVRVIANSHPLITEVLPGNVLKFRFDNIMLPDSGSNEPASHGYVIYEVDPLPSLANGTQIKNQADIYFDFNPPVITNEVMNTIIDSIPACLITTGITSTKNSSVKVYPNPANHSITIEGMDRESTIKIYDVSGRVVMTQKVVNEKTIINTTNLQNGIYLIESNSKENQFFNKIIISR